MPLTFAQANAQLASITTADQLRDLISQLDITAGGSTTVLEHTKGQRRFPFHSSSSCCDAAAK